MAFTPFRASGPVRPGAPRDSFALYLEEISRHPLLEPGEEVALARRVRAGDRAALERLVTGNLRFVVSVAKRYRHVGVPLEELVTEGNVGLLQAAERFDERRGVRFTSYAVWWIRQSMIGAIREHASIVRVPAPKAGLDRGPAGDPRRPFGVRYLSLDGPAGTARRAGGAPLGELLARQTGGSDPAGRVDRRALRDVLQAGMELLDEREATVLRLCFGLDDGEPLDLREVGARLGVSRERVRQIRERALRRLRCGLLGRELESFRL
ncbi:MAG: RNA polymerase sigma factor RpoD/SigA [Gemmatimonadota bacterium]|jgi:RNA polymerase primary sigma factor|nr:MAG: RNA polymerase sigma factor RpoD/SigA [Gemmatimonadota bacterium]